MALSASLPLKVPNFFEPGGSFQQEAMFLQLYVLINQLVVLPFLVAINRVLTLWIRRKCETDERELPVR